MRLIFIAILFFSSGVVVCSIDLAFFLLRSLEFGSVYGFRLDIHQCVKLGETATSPARRRNQREALNSTRKSFAGRTIPSGGGDLMPPSIRK